MNSILISACSIAFNPIFWNLFARLENKNRFFTRFCGDKHTACYTLAVTIFMLGLLRDYLYVVAIDSNPTLGLLSNPVVSLLGNVSIVIGNILVVSSMYKLGITGTYLGDYFGILMKERVTGFPFSFMENPMYNGSFMVFLGLALRKASLVGVFISLWVFIVYKIALLYEGPFTAAIYRKAAKDKRDKQHN